MYSENDFRLYHHGILGQKHGQRNGPPYPLSAGDHSASERKAGWRQSLSNVARKLTGRSGGSEAARIARADHDGDSWSKATTAAILAKQKESFAETEEAKAKREAEEKAAAEKREADEKARAEQEKKDLIYSGDQERIHAAAKEGKLTVQEFEEAVKRCELNKRLENSKPQEQTVDKIKTAADKLNNTANLLQNGVRAYNAVADIVNSLDPNHQLIKLDGSALQRAKDKKENERASLIDAIVRSGDAKKINDASGDMTNNEISGAAQRLKNLESIAERASKQTSTDSSDDDKTKKKK